MRLVSQNILGEASEPSPAGGSHMKSVRKLFFWLHLLAGCVAGVVILVMSVTGAILAFERQITAQVDAPAVLQGKADTSERLPVDSILAVLRSNGQGMPAELVLHSQATYPVEARYGRFDTLYLNPWTAEIVGQPSEGTAHFFGTVERIHRTIGLPVQSRFGRGITGAANLGFLFLLVTGAYLWWPRLFRWSSLRNRFLFRGSLSGKAREWNWHNVIGAWSFAPLVILVGTGVILSYPWASNLLYTATGTKPSAGGPRRGGPGPHRGRGAPPESFSAETPTQPGYHTLDEAVLIAKSQVPAWRSMTIEVPEARDKTVEISADSSMGGEPERVIQLTLDRTNGAVETVRRFRDNNAGSRLRARSRFLHTGEELGWPGQAVAMLACLGAVMLVWTGISMAVRRAFHVLTRPETRPGRAVATDAWAQE